MEKSLKKFKRSELLELLLEVSEENEQLKERIAKLENQLEEQTLVISEKGTIAEVTIKINGILQNISKLTNDKECTDNKEEYLE